MSNDEFDLDRAVAAYFEQHARNEKAISDMKAMHKADRETLKGEIATGHRNPFAHALGEFNNADNAKMLKEEIERRLEKNE